MPAQDFPHETPLATGVLVIGGGFAGLCAAIEARLAGAAVTMLDAAPVELRGGNAPHCRNIRLAADAATPWQQGVYPVGDFAGDLARIGAPDPALAALLTRDSADLGPWLAAQGVAFERWDAGNLPPSRRTMFFRGGGQALVNALVRRAAALGVDIRHGWRVDSFPPSVLHAQSSGKVEVTAQTPEGPRPVVARAAILCSGGYGGNRARLATEIGPGAHAIANRGTPFQEGGPLLWLLAHGAAAAGRPGDGHLVAVDARAALDDAGIVSRVDGMHLGLVVDADGRRFRDEGAVISQARYSAWGRALAARPDPRGWLILDAAARAKLPPMLYPPITADTPEGLARACGIEAGGLRTTLAALNAHLAGGPPPEMPRSNPSAAPVVPFVAPPFAAIPMRPGLSFTRHGLAVDETARLRLTAGGTAPRLFAAGAAMCGAVLGEGYLSGAALTIGGVFGRIAGRQAAALAGPGPGADARPMPPADATAAVATAPMEEARRALNICNTCGFCTGLCDVFPAAQLRTGLAAGDLRHLAHLCHDCRSCFHDCQYAPPHDLAVNLPAALAAARAEDLGGRHAAARSAGLFLAGLLAVPLAALALIPAEVLFAAHRGPGAFYAVIPHGAMSAGAGLAFGGALGILALRLWRFWRDSVGPPAKHGPRAMLRAARDVLVLRNLGNCENTAGPAGAFRRRAHHLLAYGFALSFLATLSGAALHHLAGQLAPYPFFSAPVLLGTIGGFAMLAGLAGLEVRQLWADRAPAAPRMAAADRVLRLSLATVAATGLALLALRETAAMGPLLALHLGSVLGLALALPFGKLAHGGFRGLALARHRAERAARGLR